MTQRNRWVRSWLPADHPLLQGNRPRVIDHIERFPIVNYDYRPLIENHVRKAPGAGLIHVDWDTAFGIETRDAFEFAARASADRVVVAPVKIYPDSTALPETVWNHRLPSEFRDLPGSGLKGKVHDGWRWVTPADQQCALFGFGMIYIPYEICADFIKDWSASSGVPGSRWPLGTPINDYAFSMWYFEKYGLTDITWDIIPVHIHWESAYED